MLERLLNKAAKSSCRYQVAAFGVNKKGELVGVSFSQPRFCRSGGSIHAEMALMRRYGNKIKKIYIARVSRTKNMLPINPCKVCQKTADSLGIKIISILDDKIKEKNLR